MSFDDIANRMKKLGFTAYEAKAYVSLLQNNPVTRYELSKNSGVPRSAIYDVIRKLEVSGAVNGLYMEPEKYTPLPPVQLFDLLERQFHEKVEDAKQALKHFETNIEPGHLWNIVGYKNMLHKAREMIGRAKESIYLSVWRREFRLLQEELLRAKEDRGVEIIAFSFTPLDFHGDKIYTYDVPEKKLAKIWDHKIILVVDQNELLMGEADHRFHKKTAWTRNTAIVDIATNHLILDITLYGIRKKIDVGHTVTSMQKGDYENLSELLEHNLPDHLEVVNRNG
jgi:sugar-specific transcriptional regulator TrmB